MKTSVRKPSAPLVLVCGEDDFAVQQRGRQLYADWCKEIGGMDHETIDATVSNSQEALRSLARLREALQTLPFFGSGKVIWLRQCNFLGDERVAGAQAVTVSLNDLAQELKRFPWDNVRLLITAGKVDRRKTFSKTIEKLGAVEYLAGLSADDKDWADRAERFVRGELRTRRQEMSDEALGELVSAVGPNLRQLSQEIEKLSLYAAGRPEITVADVHAVVSRNKQARAFALGEALGDRDLPRALRCLDEELWEMQFDRQKTAIGLLYGLISKVRTLLLLKEMFRLGLLAPDVDYNRFKSQLGRLPSEAMPDDKRYNPAAMHPYVLFKALPQAGQYTAEELVRAMDVLLVSNRRLVSSQLEEALVLQQALVQIVGRPPGRRPGRLTARAS
ncbi:MAG: DNA polymerase III subunit delta [Verrucomicrobia bacterium]|nr:DNA polymerase III subunit delta [Verrucomicrobiota bacterium]NMD19064.1 DNA polymerase III subunit delta [Verrucomicrobiota bacterium]HOF47078.1 DNA polymerase III subunit delta [Verrucomicrobiota bacterium]HOG85851.1 DNA polymerase III subunit delta [Verrucomicrobiota bacterium]HOR70092.1 DNA polymerase III subunit delta [Verrucomicrobiota bacterium]